jgi:hypothetical protein
MASDSRQCNQPAWKRETVAQAYWKINTFRVFAVLNWRNRRFLEEWSCSKLDQEATLRTMDACVDMHRVHYISGVEIVAESLLGLSDRTRIVEASRFECPFVCVHASNLYCVPPHTNPV